MKRIIDANQELKQIYNPAEMEQMISDTIFILLLPGGGVPVGGGGRRNDRVPINHKNKEFFSHLPPRPLGTPPPTGRGELR